MNGEQKDVGMELPKTIEEFEAKINSDADFRDKFLSGEVKMPEVAESNESTQVAEPPKEEPKQPEAAPSQAVQQDNGTFLVTFEDGSKLEYRNKDEAIKAIGEKERYIREQKRVIDDFKSSDKKRSEQIAELENKIKSLEGSKTEPVKREEEGEIDPFDLEFQKKQRQRLLDLEDKYAALLEDNKKRAETEKERAEREEKERLDNLSRLEAERAKYSFMNEASSFIAEVPELRTEKSPDILNTEYADYLAKLGTVLKTDGSMDSNITAFSKILDPNSQEGKTLKVTAEQAGLVLSNDLNKYVQFLQVRHARTALNTLYPGITLKETYNKLKAMNGGFVGGESKQSQSSAPLSDKAQALAAAEALKGTVASDISGSGNASVDVSMLSDAEQTALFNMSSDEMKRNPQKKELRDRLFKFYNIEPPKVA
jgi:hypothetical protein